MTTTITGPGLENAGAVWAWNLASAPARTGGGGGEARNVEDPSKPLNWSTFGELLTQGSMTGAGKAVTPETAMRVSTVFACVRIVAFSIARMPLVTYARTDDGRERAKDHPLYRLLKIRPNPEMSAFSFRSTLMTHLPLWGNAYAEIVRTRSGKIAELWPIEPWRVQPFREDGQLRYRVTTDGRRDTLMPRDMIHIPGLSFDGIKGLSVIAYARQTIGAALAADEFAGTLLRNGLRPSGVLSHPGRLGDEALKRLRESFAAVYGGSANAGKPLITEEGMTWTSNAMPLEDAQFIEGGQFRVEELCRWYGVPPHKVGHLLRSTNNNIEQQSLDFLGDTLSPWVEASEQEINHKLFTEAEQDRFYCEHLTQSIVQLDVKSRGEFYERLYRLSSINADEIRERENLNRLPDGRGQTYWTQGSNMPVPNEDQRDKIIEAWIRKGIGRAPKDPAEPREGGQ